MQDIEWATDFKKLVRFDQCQQHSQQSDRGKHLDLRSGRPGYTDVYGIQRDWDG